MEWDLGLWCGETLMAFPLQATQNTASQGASTTFSLSLPAFGSPVTSGNTVAVSYAFNTGGGTLSTSVTDDKSNVYTIGPTSLGVNDPFTGANLVTAYCRNITNAPTIITITAGGTVSAGIFIGGAAYEVPGPVTVDVNTSAVQASNTAINVPFTTSTAGEYVIGSVGSASGLTITSQNNGWVTEQGDAGIGSYQIYATLASAGSNSWQASSSPATHIAIALLSFFPSGTSASVAWLT
jgi:hypothetical protein